MTTLMQENDIRLQAEFRPTPPAAMNTICDAIVSSVTWFRVPSQDPDGNASITASQPSGKHPPVRGGVARLLWAVTALPLLALPPAAQAGGTLVFSELLPMLHRRPQLSGFLFRAFLLPDSAFAAVRLGSHFSRLGGARLGPYLFEVQPRDPAAAGAALISLCTEARFLDGVGNPLPSGDTDPPPTEATAVREEITAIVIREPSAIDSGFGCP